MKNSIFCTALGFALVAGATAASAQTAFRSERFVEDAGPPAETLETIRTVESTSEPRRVVVRHVARSRIGHRVVRTRTIIRERFVRRPTVVAELPAYTDPGYAGLYDVVEPEHYAWSGDDVAPRRDYWWPRYRYEGYRYEGAPPERVYPRLYSDYSDYSGSSAWPYYRGRYYVGWSEPVYPRLYDVVEPDADAVAPVAVASFYRYVYEPDRILVVDRSTGIVVRAIPR